MGLFTGDLKVIEEDIKELLECINHSKNQAESLHIYDMIQTLNYFNNYCNSTKHDYFQRNLTKSKSFMFKQNDNHNRKLKQSINNLIANKKIHLEFIKELMDDKDIEYPVHYESVADEYSFSDREMYDIITSFLGFYNVGSSELLDRLIEEQRIHKAPLYDETRGFTISNCYNDKYNIFISDENNLESLIALTHEFGHVIDYKNMHSRFSLKDAYSYHMKSIFIETISSLYEKDFTEFLIKEKVYPNASRNYLVNYFISMYYYFEYANVTCNLPDRYLINQKYKKLKKDKMIDILLDNENLEVEVEEIPVPSDLDVFSDLEYGYGKFLATYFSYLRNNDKNKFNDQFDRFLDIRYDYFRPDFLEYIGTSRSEAIKIVEEEINSSTGKVIVKKAS